jgi:hypothetical protein
MIHARITEDGDFKQTWLQDHLPGHTSFLKHLLNRFEVFKAVNIKIPVFRDLMPHILVDAY